MFIVNNISVLLCTLTNKMTQRFLSGMDSNGVSLSEPHTSVTASAEVVCMLAAM